MKLRQTAFSNVRDVIDGIEDTIVPDRLSMISGKGHYVLVLQHDRAGQAIVIVLAHPSGTQPHPPFRRESRRFRSNRYGQMGRELSPGGRT